MRASLGPDGCANRQQRICFQIEEAHWFYQDFIRPLNPGLPNVDLRMFIHQIFNHIPQSVIQHIPQGKTENAFTDFMVYKKRVPVRGAIMLNMAMNKCVLVKGWKSSSSFSFPRGKIDQDEDDRDCAMREALEETGFDLRGMVAENDFIELPVRDQNVKLYIAPGVPDDAKFAPQTRCEISVRAAESWGWSGADGCRKSNGTILRTCRVGRSSKGMAENQSKRLGSTTWSRHS